MSSVLQVPVAFFFDDATGADTGEAASRAYTDDFLATKDGLALIKAFMRIKNVALRRSIVRVVESNRGTEFGFGTQCVVLVTTAVAEL
jgi:hypothetical protein